MAKVSSVKMGRLMNSISVLKKALTVNIILVAIRLVSYVFCILSKSSSDSPFAPSYHFCMLSLIPYTVYLLYHSALYSPLNEADSKGERSRVHLTHEELEQKEKYISFIGGVMVVCNSTILIIKQCFLTKPNAFYLELCEVFISNIFLCMFVVKDSRICTACVSLCVVIWNLCNFMTKNDAEFIDSCATTLNCAIGSCFIMYAWQAQYDELFQSKLMLEKRGSVLKSILELFTSGIIFYNCKGNDKVSSEFNDSMKNNMDGQETSSLANERTNAMEIYDMFQHKQSHRQSLDDAISKIYSSLKIDEDYLSENDFNIDNIIVSSNNTLEECELKDLNGNIIKEFSIKFDGMKTSEDNKIIKIIKDVAEQVRVKQSMISDRIKNIMLCSISHELRSPVNQINGVLSLLLPTLKTSEQKKLLKIANSSTEMLRIKINDMLDYYEIETKNFKPEMTKFYPREQLKFLESLFLPLINKLSVKLFFFVKEETPRFIYQDQKRIMQILVNLLSNAIKYTKKGAIIVIVDWIERSDSRKKADGYLKFTVSDSGCGIPKNKRANIFKLLDCSNISDVDDRKNQNHNSTKLAGTGLGISQKIALQLGSKIEFTSIVNTGSKFYFKVQAGITNGSPNFAPVSRYHQRMKLNSSKAQLKDKHLSLTKLKPEVKNIDINPKTKMKRSLSIDEGNGNYEKVNFQVKKNKFSLIDIDQVYKDVSFDEHEMNLDLSDNKDKDKMFLNRYSRISLKQDLTPDDTNECSIPDEMSPKEETADCEFIQETSIGHKIKRAVKPKAMNQYFTRDFDPRVLTSSKCLPGDDCFDSTETSAGLSCVRKQSLSLYQNNYELSSPSKSKFAKLQTNHQEILISGEIVNNGVHKCDDEFDPEISRSEFKKPCGCPSILIVDDQYINRFIIKGFCDRYGINSLQAEDGQEAIERILEHNENSCCDGLRLVLMDLNMPVLGGIEAARKLKELKRCQIIKSDLKIVAVTAFPSEKEKEKCYAMGMEQLFIKPFTITNFVELIESKD